MKLLIHSAEPQWRPVVITIVAQIVRPSPLFKISQKVQARIVITICGTVGPAEWIIDDTYVS